MHGGICYLLFGWCWGAHKSPTPIACTLLSDLAHATFRFPVLAALLCYKKGGLVWKSGCHGCPALHRRTGPLAPHDNHSLAKGHRFGPILASNLLLCCWSVHKSLAPRTRTLLGVLGQATLNFVAVATLLFCCLCECPKFCDLAKQRRKMFLGFLRSEKSILRFFFSGCVSFPRSLFLLLRSRVKARWMLQKERGRAGEGEPAQSTHRQRGAGQGCRTSRRRHGQA